MKCKRSYHQRALSTCSRGAKTTPLAVKLLMIASVVVLSAFNVFAEYPEIWQVAAETGTPASEQLVSFANVEISDAADTDIPEIDRASTMPGCPVSMNMMVSCWIAMFPGSTVEFISTVAVSPTAFDAAPARMHHNPPPEVLIQPPRV